MPKLLLLGRLEGRLLRLRFGSTNSLSSYRASSNFVFGDSCIDRSLFLLNFCFAGSVMKDDIIGTHKRSR